MHWGLEVLVVRGYRLFITNVKGTFFGMSSLERHQEGAETAAGVPCDSSQDQRKQKKESG